MEKENRVIWRVKMRDELDLAALATNPDEAAHHTGRAKVFQGFADAEVPPYAPDDLNVP
jgi:hypothetical protein